MTHQNDNSRTIAMLVGGIAAGIVGSRLLPPLIAAVTGSRRAKSGGDPFALLIDDHRQIKSILDKMADAPTDSTARRAGLFLMLKRKLAKHAMAEEDVVYPITKDRKHLYDEHADMKILLYEIENNLKNGEEWSNAVRHLRDLIRHHVEEEETNVFPTLRQQLDRSKLPTLSGQISREEALVV